jgi:hypothetical protein
LLSFAAYLLPVFVPHGGWQVLGFIVLGALSQAASDPAFFLFFLVVALLLQFILAVLIYFFLRNISFSRVLLMLLAVPLLLIGLHVAFYFGLPYLFLYEAERRPEQGDLATACVVENASLAPYHSGVSLAMERASETLILIGQSQERARLRMPGCRVEPMDSPRRSTTYDQIAPGGFLLFRNFEGVIHIKRADEDAFTLTAPAELTYWKPVMSDDGSALFWIAKDPGLARGGQSLFWRMPDQARVQKITLDELLPLGLVVAGADSKNGPFTLTSSDDRVFYLDQEGHILSAITDLGDINLLGEGFGKLDDGFVAWDAYRDEGRYGVTWSRAGKRGSWQLPKGHRIEDLAVQPHGDLIAVSITAGISFELIKPAVVIISTASGEELYRRNRPKFARGGLAFLGNDHLALTRYEEGQNWVEVHDIRRLR